MKGSISEKKGTLKKAEKLISSKAFRKKRDLSDEEDPEFSVDIMEVDSLFLSNSHEPVKYETEASFFDEMDGKEFDSSSTFSQDIHSESKPLCLEGATTSEQAPFACHWDHCQLFFRVLGDLTKHVESHYTYTKGTICLWRGCWRQGRRFEGGRHMVFHMNSHTGARPFQCPLCDKRFSTVPNYRTHTKNVHHSNSLKYLYIDYDPVCSPHQQLSATANNTGKKYKTIVKPESTLSLRSSVESSSTNLNSPSPSPSPSLSPSSPLSLSPPLSFNASKSRSKPSTRHNSKLKSITPNTPIFSTPPPSSIPLPASSRVPLKRIEKSKPSSIHPITIPNTLPEIKARLLELNDQLQGLLGKTAHFQVSTTLVTSLQELEKQCKLTLNKLSPFTSTTTNLSSFPLKSN